MKEKECGHENKNDFDTQRRKQMRQNEINDNDTNGKLKETEKKK